jgi:hypothetical protein
MGRLILAGLLGAVAMFAWSAFSHTVLPLGHIGYQALTDEAPALAALKQSTGDKAGLYMFPGPTTPGIEPHSEKGMAEITAKIANGPSGHLVYHPAGREAGMGPYLIVEFVLELIQSLILAWLLVRATVAGLVGRTIFAAVVGVAVAIATNGSYWNWFGYPADYTLASMLIQVVGYAIAGLAIAFVLGWKGKSAPAA